MDYEEIPPQDRLIDAALDDELSTTQESELFARLAEDAELRVALRASQAIRGAARAYSSSMTPPAEAGARLFARLDIDLSPATIPTSLKSGAARFGRSTFLSVAGAILILGSLAWFHFSSTGRRSESLPQGQVDQAQQYERSVTSPSEGAVRGETHDGTLNEPSSASEPGMARDRGTGGARAGEGTDALSNAVPSAHKSEREGNRNTGSLGVITRAAPSSSARPDRTASVAADGATDSGAQLNNASASGTRRDRGMARRQSSSPGAAGVPAPPVDKLPIALSDSRSSIAPAAAGSGNEQEVIGSTRQTATDATPSAMSIFPAPAGLPIPDAIVPLDGQSNSFPHARFVAALANVAVRLRGFSTASSPAASIGQKSTPIFDNVAVAALYTFSEEHAVALEVGQEAFPQEYSGTENGKSVRYQQNLLAPWLTGSYMYRPAWARFGSAFSPIASIGAGITRERWPMARAMLGLRYSPLSHVSMEAGVEGTLLAYPFLDKRFTTRKIGATYGLVIAF